MVLSKGTLREKMDTIHQQT